LRLPVKQRLEMLFDGGKYKTIDLPDVPHDPLKFKDKKRYADRLRDARYKTELKDAMTIAEGTINGNKIVIAAFNFSFMGGSMGIAVGESIIKAAQRAVETGAAFMTVPASGGARMQEGLLSLMQMPRTIIAVEQVKEAGLPYLVLLTDPTTGGVSASFAMVGDIHIAEPGAMIGFAGRRVIEETVRETLPDDFQTSEYLLEKGMVDMVVSRKDMAATIGRILDLLMNKKQPPRAKKDDGIENANTNAKSTKNGNGQKSNAGRTPASYEKATVKKAAVTDKKPANVNASQKAKKKSAAG